MIGFYVANAGLHGFLDINGTFTTLDDPNAASYTFPYAINDSGEIVGLR